MPRDGSNIYHRPAGTDGVPDTPIESAKYNAYIADVEQDLNLPRPIVAGGTGATNVQDAMTALGGEIANQVVTNYDSDPILPGSFYSTTSATATPVTGHAFVGFAYGQTSGGLVIEVRDLTDANDPHIKYTRTRSAAGVWSTWKVDGRTIIGTNEGIGGATADMFFGVTGTSPTSSFIVNTKADASGTNLMTVSKSGSAVSIAGSLIASAGELHGLTVTAAASIQSGAVTGGTYYFGLPSNNKYLQYDGTNYTLNGAPLIVNGGNVVSGQMSLNASNYAVTDGSNYIIRSGSATYFQNNGGGEWGHINAGGLAMAVGNISTPNNLFVNGGVVYLVSSNSRYLQWTNDYYALGGDRPLVLGYPTASNHAARVDWVSNTLAGYQGALGFTPVQQSGGSFQAGNKIYIGWDGAGLRAQVDSLDLGRFATESYGPGIRDGRLVYSGDWTMPDTNPADYTSGGVASGGWVARYGDGRLGFVGLRMRLMQLNNTGGWYTIGFA